MTLGRAPWVAALGAALALLLNGCAGPAFPHDSPAQVEAWALARGWTPLWLRAEPFDLLALLRQGQASRSLRVYIEGDGAAWPNGYRPPTDPTPQRPLVLELAERDPAVAVAYLGRPCQYLAPAALAQCAGAYWSERRFAPEVLAAMDQALSQLKQAAGAERLRLVGYSGGGVLATLLAQRRDDIDSLVTLAAPLALAEWVRLKALSPLRGSLDPLDGVGALPHAVHLVGSRDRVVPAAVGARFVAKHGGRLQLLPGFGHSCCWVQHWPALLPGEEGEP
jgi:hypothetical protein